MKCPGEAKYISSCQDRGDEGGNRRVTANGHGLSISGDEIVLKLIVTMIAQLLNTVKSIELYTRNGYPCTQICMVYEL